MACFCLGRASFEAALRKGDIAAALAHLEEEPLTIARTHFRNGNTIWHVTAGGGHLELLRALAARLAAVWPTQGRPAAAAAATTADPNQDPYQQQHQHAPLHHRRSNPFQRISDGLRGIGPDTSHLPLAAFINTPNLLGQTALMTACKEGHPACVQLLLSMGANAWYRDRANYSALHYATLHDRGACIEAVLQHPASARAPPGTRQSLVRLVDLPNFSGYTPAHFAAVANKPKALAALLAGGANIAARCWLEGTDWISGPVGSTPLHLAARRGDVELCMMMMSHYLEVLRDSGTPDPRLHADARGFRPYHRAAERGFRELAEMLMPSTPVAHIFGTDVVRLYRVPKLKALASAALQASLLSQINEVEAEAAERRRLATAAAVAAARAAAAAAGGGAATVRGTSGGGAAAANGSASGGGAADAGVSSLSRASSLIGGALQFVRRQSMQQLGSLRQQYRRSGRWLNRESSQEIRGTSGNPSIVGASEGPPGGGQSLYGGGNAGGRTISGVVGYTVAATPRQSGILPSLFGSMSRAAATAAATAVAVEVTMPEYGAPTETPTSAAVNAAAAALAPLLSAGSERSALLSCPTETAPPPTSVAATAAAAADGRSQGLAAGSAAAAILPPAAATSRAASSLPGGISPVRGASSEYDTLPSLPSSWSPIYSGLGGGDLPPPPTALGNPVAFSARYTDVEDASVGAWALRAPAAAAVARCVAGGSPVGAPSADGVPARMSYFPVSLPAQSAPASSPPPFTPTQLALSPFASTALQAQPLRHPSGGSPGGGSPMYGAGSSSVFAGAAADPPSALGYKPSQQSSWSPPRPMLLSVPGGTLGLQPVREDKDAGGGDGGGVGNSHEIERLSKRASKYAVPQGAEAPRGRTPAPDVGDPGAGAGGVGCGGGRAHGVKGRGSGGDPAGGSPPLATSFLLPGALGRDTRSSVGLGLAGAYGGAAAGSRPGSGRLQASAGSGTAAGAAAAAADGGGRTFAAAAGINIGSDTSEDFCGVCFERPAFLHIRPCQHTLCAECSREVTRMVETQPPSCPFCRGIVHGFGC